MKSKLHLGALLWLVLVLTVSAASLEEAFRSPPDSARPHTWWHWLNGHVTKTGITKDLEAMKAVGLGGFQQFDVGLKLTNGPVVYNSAEFHELTAFAIAEAHRLGLEMGFNNASGWSSSGGPWITPENSMKTLVWSETTVSGASPAPVTLAVPELREDQKKGARAKKSGFYRDIAVLAFPTPTNDTYRVTDWSEKALLATDAKADKFTPDRRAAPTDAVIRADQVITLSDRLDAQGNLSWVPPAGDWTVLRVGYASTDSMTRPASRGGIGLELDKLSRKAADVHWAALVERIIADAKGAPALTTVLIDSYEVGMANWTDDFPAQFKQRRGYDLIPQLLCVTGRVLDSTETTERVLWDLRATVAELMEANYFGYFAEKCHARGLQLAIEPYGSGTFDAPATTLLADLPMTEFWQETPRNLWQWTAQVVPSGAHLSGRHVVGAESFTSMTGNWTDHPYALKKHGDWAFARGVNRYYFHTFVHQPWPDSVKPGMTFGGFGGNFHRNNTWFPHARAWMDYIARCQFIFQSGTFQADVLVLYGDERGFNSFLSAKEPPDVANLPGLNFDLGGMSSLANLSVEANGDLRVTYQGKLLDTRYAALLLKRADLMTPARVAQLGALADKGARIFAPKPLRSPSLHNHAEADRNLAALVERYWNSGRIRDPKDFAAAAAGLVPACELPADLLFNRHRLGADDFYFVANQKTEAREVNAIFRTSGKLPELWNPVTGEVTPAPNWQALPDGRTEVSLRLAELDSVFVVFRQPTTVKGKATPRPATGETTTLDQPWTVTFDPQWGPAKPVTMTTLAPWNESPDDAVKYYSGTATYRTTFDLTKTEPRWVLDLGKVAVLARVTLNGRDLGTLWKPPFQVDVTAAAHPGQNQLEIAVTNLWVNRLIGDERFAPAGSGFPDWLLAGQTPPSDLPRKTFVAFRHWKKDSPLLPSGLIGPVTLRSETPTENAISSRAAKPPLRQ